MKNNIETILKKKSLTASDWKTIENYEPNDDMNRLYSFFTPVWLCKVMYDLAKRYGFNPSGKILEPACGNGNFLKVLDKPENCTAFELDNLNYKIAKKRVPEVTYYNQYFETAFLHPPRYTTHIKKDITWLKNYPFDLVIGNPPYGTYTNHYSSYFKKLKIKQVEQFFMYKCMQLLKKDGLLVFITASAFLKNEKTYTHAKTMLSQIAEFVDAYRMPKVFKNTQAPTDIIILKRK